MLSKKKRANDYVAFVNVALCLQITRHTVVSRSEIKFNARDIIYDIEDDLCYKLIAVIF
jgi:hypothetical protein